MWVLVMFVRKTTSGVALSGAGIAARWTTASMPGSTSAAAERLERLAVVGEVGGQERRGVLVRRDAVDVEHVVAVLAQVAHDGAAGLAAASGDGDLHAWLISDVRTPAIWLDRLRNRRSNFDGDNGRSPSSPIDRNPHDLRAAHYPGMGPPCRRDRTPARPAPRPRRRRGCARTASTAPSPTACRRSAAPRSRCARAGSSTPPSRRCSRARSSACCATRGTPSRARARSPTRRDAVAELSAELDELARRLVAPRPPAVRGLAQV